MKLHELSPAKGARQKKVRVGRGIGSGYGKTAGRGYNGQNARSGGSKAGGFEGGQMPLTQKMPKRGFHNPFKIEYDIINIRDLQRFKAGTQIDPTLLAEAGLVRKHVRVKILGQGEAPAQIHVRAHKFSKSAADKLAAAGGSSEVLK